MSIDGAKALAAKVLTDEALAKQLDGAKTEAEFDAVVAKLGYSCTAAEFDAAFKEYINRWAFKHPTPWDFFHTIENVAGEDLGWFWRAWVLNTWKLDQAVTGVKYAEDKPENGANISIENLEQMAMPVTVLVKEANGKQHKIDLPVEVWQRGAKWTFGVPTTSEVTDVILDPDKKLPDWNRDNNNWKKKAF